MTDQDQKTRHALISQKMGFNQMRNSIYWLQRYMHQYNLTDDQIKARFIHMGRNIGATFAKELDALQMELPDLLKEIYYLTVRSKVKISIDNNSLYKIKDSNSALDKYPYDDLTISGDYIIVAAVTEILERFGYAVKHFSVTQCRSHGDNYSEHQYQIDPKELNI